MTRRTALALATSVALSAAGVTFAVGTTLGLFGAAHTSGPTGRLSPVADSPASPRVETVYVDVTATPAPARPGARTAAPPRPAATPSPEEQVVVVVDDPTPSPAYSAHDDDHTEDEGHEGEDEGHEGDD